MSLRTLPVPGCRSVPFPVRLWEDCPWPGQRHPHLFGLIAEAGKESPSGHRNRKRPGRRAGTPERPRSDRNDPASSGKTLTEGGQNPALCQRHAEYSTAEPHHRPAPGRYSPDPDKDPGRSSAMRASWKRYPSARTGSFSRRFRSERHF